MGKLILALMFLGMQGQFYFMMVAFSIPGTQEHMKPFVGKFIDRSLILLPAVCAVAGVVVLIGHFRHWAHPYVWCLAPIPIAILWFLIRIKLG